MGHGRGMRSVECFSSFYDENDVYIRLLWLQYKLLSYAHYFKNIDDITCIIVNVRMVFGKTILFATELDSLSRMALLLL